VIAAKGSARSARAHSSHYRRRSLTLSAHTAAGRWPQACQLLGMGRSWVYRQIRNHKIPSVRLGRTIEIRRSDLKHYLEE